MTSIEGGAKQHYFTNLDFPYAKTWDKEKEHMTITMQNVHYSIANSIRRSIMSMVNTIGFRALPYEQATIIVEKNDTYLNNEIIKHRISMIPVYVEDDFELDDYEFIIDEVNNTNLIQLITTENFKIKRISTNSFLSEKDVRSILPADPNTGEFIPIVKLKPKYYTDLGVKELADVPKNITVPNSTPISIKLTAKLVKSNGLENAHFSPVCTCAYRNTIDESIIAQKESEYVIETNKHNAELGLSAIDDEVLRRRFRINELYRYYKTDEYGEPNSFDFTIESVGRDKPLLLIHKGITELVIRLDDFIQDLNTRNTEKIVVYPSATIGNGFEIKSLDMDDTLGNIIHCHLVNNCCLYDLEDKRSIESVTYNKTHPLENNVLFTVRNLKSGTDETVNTIVDECRKLSEFLKNLNQDLEKIYI